MPNKQLKIEKIRMDKKYRIGHNMLSFRPRISKKKIGKVF